MRGLLERSKTEGPQPNPPSDIEGRIAMLRKTLEKYTRWLTVAGG